MALHDDLEFITNLAIDESDRIERMKGLLIDADKFTKVEAAEIADILEAIVCDRGENTLLRQHAANEVGHYRETPSEHLRELFHDKREDLDLRFNLQASFTELDVQVLDKKQPEQVEARDAE